MCAMGRLQDEIAVELERMAAQRGGGGIAENSARRIGTIAAAAIRPAGARPARRAPRRWSAGVLVRRAIRRLRR
jgi:hypothetical protein